MTKIDISQFKKWVPQPRAILEPNEVSIIPSGIYIPKSNIANFKVNDSVDFFYREDKQVILLKRNEKGIRNIKSDSKRAFKVNCKPFLEMLKVKKGHYKTEYDEESGLFVIYLGD